MFVTLKEFYDNFRIRNGDKPNETVFNRPLFRLKREIRELRSVLGIITGVNPEVWNSNKYYERDEYVIYNSKFYRSLFDGNVGNDPTLLVAWAEETPIQFYTKAEIDSMISNLNVSGTGTTIINNDTYRIITVGNNYTPVNADFDGRTIIRVNTNLQASNINIIKPFDESFIGKTLIIRKVNGDDSLLHLTAGNGVVINPPDASPMRRIGSSVALVYVGNGVYDAYGELP